MASTLLPRVIGLLAVVGGELSRTKHFEPDYAYTDQYVDFSEFDEIVVVRADKTATSGLEASFEAFVQGILPRCFLPLSIGGWIRDPRQADALFELGADRVVIGSASLQPSDLITRLASVWGSQALIGSVAVLRHDGELWAVDSTDPWAPSARAEAVIHRMTQEGVGELLLNFVDRDGSLLGPDLEGAAHLMTHTDVPVVVAGGIGSWRHMYEVLSGLGASGVATSNIYHLAPQSIRSAKNYLTSQGVKVRRSSEILIPEAP